MRRVLCEFNSVNGSNTGTYTRRGMGKSYPSAGILLKKNCPNGIFYIDADDGGTNDYYKLINPQDYTGIDASGPVYVLISSQYLKRPKPSEVATTPTVQNSISNIQSSIPSNMVKTQLDNIDEVSSYDAALDVQIMTHLEDMKVKDLIDNSTRVFGAPFQFTNVTDHRPFVNDKLDYGRKYLENIIAEAPVVYITPGLPDYMPDADTSTKEAMDSYIKNRASGQGIDPNVINAINDEDVRFYGFVPAYTEYMRYVNLLCRVCAHYMGIENRPVPGYADHMTYGKFDWARYTNINYSEDRSTTRVGIFEKIGGAFHDFFDASRDSLIDNIFGDYKYVKMYVDPSSSFNESASNSTGQSQIAGLFDSLESIVKEIGFFSNGSGILSGVTDGIGSMMSGSMDATVGVLDPNVSAGLSKIISNASRVIAGSNVIFPDLWQDSQYSRSYNFNINLISPYGDVESIYLNIIVPMMFVLAFSMPRQTSANSFGSPFLIQIFSKGWFSCDLGIVESVSIEKVGGSYNVHGLPNEVKINLSVRDLYSNLMISKSSTPVLFFKNQGLIEFLAVTCGLDITKGDIGLKIDTIISTFKNSLFDMPSELYDNIIQSIRNAIEPWFKITR